jgi:hypothetical protein
MSNITELRAAIGVALADLDSSVSNRPMHVYTWPAPKVELPAAVVGDNEPLVEPAGEENGYARVIRFRILCLLPPHMEEVAFEQMETWIDQMDDLMTDVVPPAGVTTPAVTSISARGLVAYAETQHLGVFFDIEAHDQTC